MTNGFMRIASVFFLFIFISGCATTTSTEYTYTTTAYKDEIKAGTALGQYNMDPALEEKILALDPENISEKNINETLSLAPAPRIINIHGGIYPVHLLMISFSDFLISMGYPEEKVRNPVDGTYSYSCYMNSDKFAGLIAWYYEKEGMRPLMVGHSQGGMQAVKVLHELAGTFSKKIKVWNPLTEQFEDRYSIIDPFTGLEEPVVGQKVEYASAVGAGGFTRFLPSQWSILTRLRSIPDSVENFTGFYMGFDIVGGDLLGFGPANKFKPNGKANVRNVKLPLGYNHVTVPGTRHLAESQEIRDWINNYTQTEEPVLTAEFDSSSKHILWAADVWHSIKKYWVLELQRLINARQKLNNAN